MAGWLLLTRLIALLLPFTVASTVGADITTGWDEERGIYEMVFPIVGDTDYEDNFGACRGTNCSRSHEGIDILAEKMTPVVAVASGTVAVIRDERGGNCCMMAIDHDDGWRTWYVHLNNDTPGTDDGMGWGFAPGIARGVRVEAGQVVGYVGDSGNAETTPPHLHFELIGPDGIEIDPYPHLLLAELHGVYGGMREPGSGPGGE